MTTISNWTAKRSGGRITIEGADEAGIACKLAGIDRIGTRNTVGSPLFAVDMDGAEHRLTPSALPPEFLARCAYLEVDPAIVLDQFIRDLCDLDGSSGSAERSLAQNWFNESYYRAVEAAF